MIEKRVVQWYAANSGVSLGIAEREIVLTYVLKILNDAGLLNQMAFKGGAAIRKIFLGNQGRFSLDMDFTMMNHSSPEKFVLDVVSVLHNQEHFGITFELRPEDYYAKPGSCEANITYHHSWSTNGKFSLQVSFRAKPILPVKPASFIKEPYFQWLEMDPPMVPTLDFHEIIGEKIRAAAQRSRIRDIYDLYQFASLKYDRNIVRRIAILKCWETNYSFDPVTFLKGLPEKHDDWSDLKRLFKQSKTLTPLVVFDTIQQSYLFLTDMDDDEAILSNDPNCRERQVYQRLIARVKEDRRAAAGLVLERPHPPQA